MCLISESESEADKEGVLGVESMVLAAMALVGAAAAIAYELRVRRGGWWKTGEGGSGVETAVVRAESEYLLQEPQRTRSEYMGLEVAESSVAGEPRTETGGRKVRTEPRSGGRNRVVAGRVQSQTVLQGEELVAYQERKREQKRQKSQRREQRRNRNSVLNDVAKRNPNATSVYLPMPNAPRAPTSVYLHSQPTTIA